MARQRVLNSTNRTLTIHSSWSVDTDGAVTQLAEPVTPPWYGSILAMHSTTPRFPGLYKAPAVEIVPATTASPDGAVEDPIIEQPHLTEAGETYIEIAEVPADAVIPDATVGAVPAEGEGEAPATAAPYSMFDGTTIDVNPDPSLKSVDDAFLALFESYSVPRPGGASGHLGWSSFSTFQRCPYLYKRVYLDAPDGVRTGGGSQALEIGSTIHTLLAVKSLQLINQAYPISPEMVREFMLTFGCSPEVIMESWRVFTSYEAHYESAEGGDYLTPIAVEYLIADEKTKESARFDLIAKVEDAQIGVMPGTYIVEHKTASRFTDDVVDGWRNDGEILGQIMLWKRLKLDKKFGKLQGVMVNILGKQKYPQFRRVIVPPQSWQIRQHADDLRVWEGYRQLARAIGVFPHARANCISRYGKCFQWDHCTEKK